MHNENFKYLLDNNGEIRLLENQKIRKVCIYKVTTDISEIVNAEIIIVYVQTNYHEDLIKRIIPYIKDGQIVVFNPGYLSTAYMLKHNYNKNITIVEAESSFIDCRISETRID